ncbi:hypothetical protein C1H46_009029 [Malus baccata]|uniref:Uncharacterized protein n=1 Tax=Malus baccata TaxID=106549 RepID=A0A540N2Q7_MALBA|nr:hypothetical protein C1H46_009029 [Malus baccata]
MHQMWPLGSTTDALGTQPDLLPYDVEVLEGDARGDKEQGAQSIVHKLQFGGHGRGHVRVPQSALL